mgnify:CR=1 FL=1
MADEQTPVVFLHQVERRYHQGEAVLEILKGAELAVWPGQSVALVAPSGSGKSTLLHLLGGLATPTAGRILVDGEEISRDDDSSRTRVRREKIGFVFQRFNLLAGDVGDDDPALKTGCGPGAVVLHVGHQQAAQRRQAKGAAHGGRFQECASVFRRHGNLPIG